jgi:hypothetical protein
VLVREPIGTNPDLVDDARDHERCGRFARAGLSAVVGRAS